MRFLLLLLLLNPASSALEVARPFGSHMVLPMEREVRVRGKAAPAVRVELRFGDRIWSTQAGREGDWGIALPPLPASALPTELVVTAGGERIVLKDVLVGRVWLCSGQSNMDFQLSRAIGGPEEAARAGKRKQVRLFNLTGAPTDARRYDAATLARLNRRDHFQGSWERATEKSAGSFSAVAWWAGCMIREETGVPVGLVENAVGGSPTEAWLPPEILRARPAYRGLLGESWYRAEKMSPWARGRAKQNLGGNPEAEHPFKPGFLFESGVADFAGFPFDGVLWYQGETNAEIDDPRWHEQVMGDLVKGWRRALRQPELPFYMVQLPRIGGRDPLRQYWPEYRRAQAAVGKSLPGVRVVVTEDLGWDSPDVHPPDKLPVARRLAEAVLEGID